MSRSGFSLPLLLVLGLFLCQLVASEDDNPRRPKNRKLRQLTAGITRCNNNINSDATFHQIEKQIRQTEFVFTGKVTGEYDVLPDEGSKGDYRGFWVRVKRMLKGFLVHGEVQLLVSKSGDGDSDRFTVGCYSIIRVHHTAIFLARRTNHKEGNTTVLVSTTDPLPITLRNLDQVDALVKDMTYKPRPTLLEEPCEKKYCPWGSNCETNNEGEARCKCPTDCPAEPGGPICGTDDVTYENQCQLRRKACLEGVPTRIRHSGKCGPHSNRRRQ